MGSLRAIGVGTVAALALWTSAAQEPEGEPAVVAQAGVAPSARFAVGPIDWPGRKHPGTTLGISAAVFRDGPRDLLLISERKELVLRFRAEPGTEPEVIELKGLPPDAEVEGAAWFEDALYLVDEGTPAVYRTPFEVEDGAVRVEPLGLKFKVSSKEDGGLEGIAVSNAALHLAPGGENGPWFYLLDEHDGKSKKKRSAIIHIAREEAGRLYEAAEPIRLSLTDTPGVRLCDLVLRDDVLLALCTSKQSYEVMRVDLITGTLTPVLDVTPDTLRWNDRYNTNLEALAVMPDGTCFLASDNQKGEKGEQDTLLLRRRLALGKRPAATPEK